MSILFGILGILAMLLIAFLMSNNRKAINYKTVIVGLILQFLLAVFILKFEPGKKIFEVIGKLVEKILESYKTNLVDLKLDKKLNLANSLASQLAIKSGQTLNAIEMQDLIDRLFACAVSEVSPDGKRIYTILNVNELKTRLS